MTALNGGQPVWSSTDHLLADLWAVQVRAHSDPKKAPADLDHPVRAETTARVRAAGKKKLKDMFLARKYGDTKPVGEVTN